MGGGCAVLPWKVLQGVGWCMFEVELELEVFSVCPGGRLAVLRPLGFERFKSKFCTVEHCTFLTLL